MPDRVRGPFSAVVKAALHPTDHWRVIRIIKTSRQRALIVVIVFDKESDCEGHNAKLFSLVLSFVSFSIPSLSFSSLSTASK